MYQVVSSVLKDLQAYSTNEVECVIYILYVLGEAMPSAGSSPPQNNQETQVLHLIIAYFSGVWTLSTAYCCHGMGPRFLVMKLLKFTSVLLFAVC